MGQGNFEQKWQQAFEGAKMTPSDKVWTGIEAAVANGEAKKYKKRAFYYQWMAAAGILLFVTLLGYLGFQALQEDNIADNQVQDQIQTQTQDQIQEQSQASEQSQDSQVLTDEMQDQAQVQDQAQTQIQTQNQNQDDRVLADRIQAQTQAQELVQDQAEIQGRTQDDQVLAESKTPAQQSPQGPQDQVQQNQDQLAAQTQVPATLKDQNPQEMNAGAALPLETAEEHETTTESASETNQLLTYQQRLLALSPLKPQDQSLQLAVSPDHLYGVALHPTPVTGSFESQGLWAGLSLAPGQFDPNYRQSNDQALSAPNFSQDANSGFTPSEQSSAGFSFSLAVDLGMQIAPRWELTGGLQYFRNQVQSSTNAALGQTPVFSSVVESLDLRSAEGTLAFSPTDLDNDFQFLSIPVQAGYLVLDKKVRLTVNAGVAADIFLKNTVTPSDESLQRVTISPGSNSPYRTLHFNGLVGIQASYEFLPRYSLTIQPQYKIAINEFTKPGSDYTSQPSSIGVGVGIKYSFK